MLEGVEDALASEAEDVSEGAVFRGLFGVFDIKGDVLLLSKTVYLRSLVRYLALGRAFAFD